VLQYDVTMSDPSTWIEPWTVRPQIVERPGLALDVDTPADLAAFLAAPSDTRAYAYLVQSGIAARLTADAQACSP
jgi:2-phospho-L-lactate guanylyltransferase (CobY/MobA/RfbA family)